MPTLRFHHELYSKPALEEALEVFVEHAEMELTEQMPYFEVEVTAKDASAEAEVVGELGNYALALTIEEKRAGP